MHFLCHRGFHDDQKHQKGLPKKGGRRSQVKKLTMTTTASLSSRKSSSLGKQRRPNSLLTAFQFRSLLRNSHNFRLLCTMYLKKNMLWSHAHMHPLKCSPISQRSLGARRVGGCGMLRSKAIDYNSIACYQLEPANLGSSSQRRTPTF